MKKSLLYITFASLLTLSACAPSEDPITPSGNYSVLRMEFPQGNNPWDEEIKEIHDKYGVYLLYKGITPADLNRKWKSVGTGKLYYGDDVPEDEVQYYVDFFKGHIFPYFTPEVLQTSFPVKIYLLKNLRGVEQDLTGGGGSSSGGSGTRGTGTGGTGTGGTGTGGTGTGGTGTGTGPTAEPDVPGFTPTKFDGFDYWAISFSNQELLNMKSDSHAALSTKRFSFINQILTPQRQDGTLAEPEGFREGIDVTTSWNTKDPTNPNYPYTRGFITWINDSGKDGSIGYLTYYKQENYKVGTSSYRDYFMSYIRAAMKYTPEQFYAKYPKEKYPLISRQYEMTVKYMKDKFGIDLPGIAKGPSANEE